MSLLAHLTDLFRHMHWADSIVWRNVIAAPHDDRTYRLLFHIHQVQHGFLAVWRDEQTPGFRDFDAFPDLPSLMQWARDYHEQLPAVLANVREEDLGRTKEVLWKRWVEKTIGRPPEPTTFAETMLQVSQHSTYHRGQVNLLSRDRGLDPPLTDFIAWVWQGKPAPAWP